MKLDPQMQMVLDLGKKAGGPELWLLEPDQSREEYAIRAVRLKVQETIYKSEDRKIPGSSEDIPVRIYTPRELKADEKLPVLVWYHGGGYVIGDLNTHDSVCRILANQTDCIVVAVDYRLAPENKFPAAVEDCFSALRWVAMNADAISGDSDRLAVGGDSAGGNLAAVVSILARDERSPKIKFQLLVYPATAPEQEMRYNYDFSEGYLLTRRLITWCYKHYQRNASDARDFRFAPLIADDLSNLPPSLVIVAGFDPLRDEGIEYAKKLIEYGNEVRLSNYQGMAHGFYLMGGAVEKANVAVAESSDMLKKSFEKTVN